MIRCYSTATTPQRSSSSTCCGVLRRKYMLYWAYRRTYYPAGPVQSCPTLCSAEHPGPRTLLPYRSRRSRAGPREDRKWTIQSEKSLQSVSSSGKIWFFLGSNSVPVAGADTRAPSHAHGLCCSFPAAASGALYALSPFEYGRPWSLSAI